MPAAAPAAEFADDFEFDDDDDDLELPSYGKRFDRGTKEEASSGASAGGSRKTTPVAAKPQTSRPAVPKPPAVKPAAAKRPADITRAPTGHRAGMVGDGRREEYDAPQATKPEIPKPRAEPRVRQKLPPAAGIAVKRPAAAKSPAVAPTKPQTTPRKPAAENSPVAERPPVAEKPRRERPPRERTSRARPPRDEPAAEFARPEIPGEKPVVERPRAVEPRDKAAPRVKPVQSPKFAALGLSEVMLDALAAATYQEPTPVQEGFIPRALAGVDVMGQAQTGTGKTAAFAIPILETLQPQRRGAPPQALVLVPTRELAVQVRDECEKLALGRNASIVAVYGGKPIRKQIEQLSQGAAFIVGTPGRVLDLMGRGALMWNELRVVVLDEADRMLDIGFRPDIEKILRRCPQSRQTLLLSATIPPPVKRLAERYMREPEMLDFSPKNLAVETIEQFYFTVDPERKFDLLVKLLEREDPAAGDHLLPHEARAPTRSARGCRGVSSDVDTIHGDLQQSSRDRVMKAFREGKVRWLVATDVVGRGIDVTSISHIINYDIPAVLRRLRASRRPHRPHGPRGRGLHLRLARGRRRADADRDAHQPLVDPRRDPRLPGL